MSGDKDKDRLNRQFEQIERRLPGWIARVLNWLRRPGVQLVRIPLGVLLVFGGIFSILPVFGLWMLPLGLLFLALDVRLIRGPVTHAIIRLQSWWRHRRQRKAAEERQKNNQDR